MTLISKMMKHKHRALLFFVALIGTTAVSAQNAAKTDKSKITLVVHGGAGTILKKDMTPEKEKAYQDALNAALQAGHRILQNGGTSLDAVEATIRFLEDSPLFNAGKGSVFTHEGKNEMDAAIMDGSTLKAGSIAGVSVIKNPISTARKVMEKSEHVMLVGRGAEQFSKEQGMEIVDPAYFHTEARFRQWKTALEEEKIQLDHSGDKGSLDGFPAGEKKFGTVGAVALDRYGNLAAGTSTGGMTNKRWNRVGDAPVIGAGTYASNQTCAVSATGHGEYFIRSVVAYDISALMEYKKLSVKQAAEEVVMKKLVQRGGEGGVIALDRNGNFAMPFNSEGMYRGYVKADGKSEVLIYK